MADRKLTPKQQIFLDQLLSNGNNAAMAYRVAYPDFTSHKGITGAASRLRRHPIIAQALAAAHVQDKRAVESAVERYAITADRVADELARLAFTRMPQVADVVREAGQDGKQRVVVQVKPFAEADQEALAAIIEVKRTAGGEISIKLADKRAALMDLARFKGWIADKPVDQRQLVMLKIER